jgi:hypothetical protein
LTGSDKKYLDGIAPPTGVVAGTSPAMTVSLDELGPPCADLVPDEHRITIVPMVAEISVRKTTRI